MSCWHTNSAVLCNIPSSVATVRPHRVSVLIALWFITYFEEIPNSSKTQPPLDCARWGHKECGYLGILINRRNIGGTGTIKRLWWVEKQEQDWEKEEGDFEKFLRSLLLSLAGVYASGNVLQCGPAADWLESDGCLCWPEIAPLPLPNTQPPAALNSTCTRNYWLKMIVNII